MVRVAHFLGSVAAFFLLLNCHHSNGIELGSNGGYIVKIAINDDIIAPENINEFIEQFRTALGAFTFELWASTNETFFIDYVDLLLPLNWAYDGLTGLVSAADSYAASDIRLASTDSFHVENPHRCGRAGEYIQLPFTFLLGNNNEGVFGRPAKALLTQWARYRWGVWEEHGYPDDDQFSYFYREDDDGWVTNTCSDFPLNGEYIQWNNDEVCDATQEDPLDVECRFVPSDGPENIATTTSLMGYHWLDSVTQFCDEDTHNRLAPNRQNILCEYQSVWEVIRSTDDFNFVTEPITNGQLPGVTLNILQHSSNVVPRALYILLDRGIIREQAVEGILLSSLLESVTANFINNTEILQDDVFVAAGAYPGLTQVVDELLPWNPVIETRVNFAQIVETFAYGASANRDFIDAIFQVSQNVRSLSPANGAIILVIKTGAPGATYFESAILEEEVSATLIKNNIKLYALEISDASSGEQGIQRHLENLAESTIGYHDTVYNITAIEEQVTSFVESIAIDFLDSQLANPNFVGVSYKGILEQNTPYTVSLTRLSDVTINLITTNNPGNILQINGINPTPNPIIQDEWNSPNRQRHSYTHLYNVEEESLEVVFLCVSTDSCDGVNALLYITEEFPYGGDSIPEMTRLQITAGASITEAVIDFQLNTSPYVLHAKVELDGQPVVNAIVTATAQLGDVRIDVPLLDDGIGNADVLQFDGIYSSYFVPPTDGKYFISIDVTSDLSVTAPQPPTLKETNPNSGRLLPVDQGQIGCGGNTLCGTFLSEEVNVNQNFATVTFLQVDLYPNRGIPERVTNFTVTNLDDVLVTFSFTSPKIIGGGASDAAERYVLFGAATSEDMLLSNYVPFSTLERTDAPGSVIEETFSGLPTSFLYFRVQAFPEGFIGSELSTIVRINKALPVLLPPDEEDPQNTSETPEEEAPFFETAGGIVVIVLLVLIGVAALGGAFWWCKKKRN